VPSTRKYTREICKIARILTFRDILSLLVDVVLLLNVNGSHECADPYDEGLILALEEVYGLVDLFVNLHGDLDPNLVGQLLNEVHDIFRLAQVVVLDGAYESVVEVCLQLVLLLDLVKNRELLL